MLYVNHIEAIGEFRSFFLQPEVEIREISQQEDVYGYWASESNLQNRALHISSFLNNLLPEEQGINPNQVTILSYANKIFEGSRPLSEFEEEVLAQTLSRLAKRKPTRPNRQ